MGYPVKIGLGLIVSLAIVFFAAAQVTKNHNDKENATFEKLIDTPELTQEQKQMLRARWIKRNW